MLHISMGNSREKLQLFAAQRVKVRTLKLIVHELDPVKSKPHKQKEISICDGQTNGHRLSYSYGGATMHLFWREKRLGE